MADRSKFKHKLKNGGITFGLREAVILAVVAIAVACAVVYYHVT
jgi:hypothetical protein